MSALLFVGMGIAGLFGLLFLARSFRRLCQGRFFESFTAMLMAGLCCIAVMFGYAYMAQKARSLAPEEMEGGTSHEVWKSADGQNENHE